MEERFTYDHLNRLTGIWLNNSRTGWMDYDAYGRMTGKITDNTLVFSGAVYDETAKPHAIDYAEVDAGSFSEHALTYTCFDKVKTITQGSNTLEYTYGYDRQRVFMEELANGVERTKRYVGNCEFVTETENNATTAKTLTYLKGPMGVFAVVETIGNEDALHYILKDHLGSWTTITDADGIVEQELSFDAWGTRRNPESWHASNQLSEPMFDRGFTGHEHLYTFGLVNMNGRMYDPQMSSFLSVDAYVQSPDNSQSFNRYVYCLNNPLKYTDPTGWLKQGAGYGTNATNFVWGDMSYVEHSYSWRELCGPGVRGTVAMAVLTSYRIGNDCSIDGFVSVSASGVISDISVIIITDKIFNCENKFNGAELNCAISSKTKGKCVVTSLGSTNKYWFSTTGKYGDGTKRWIEKSKAYEIETGHEFNNTLKNLIDYIQWNDDKESYSKYDVSPVSLSEIYDALKTDGYAVAACVQLIKPEDIENNEGQKAHMANVKEATIYNNGSLIKLTFIEPNGTNLMKPFNAPITNGIINPPDYLEMMFFIKYKLIVP